MRLELAQTFAVGIAHPTVTLYLIMLDYLVSETRLRVKAISMNEYTQVSGFRLRSTLNPLFRNGTFIAGDRLNSTLVTSH